MIVGSKRAIYPKARAVTTASTKLKNSMCSINIAGTVIESPYRHIQWGAVGCVFEHWLEAELNPSGERTGS